VTGTPRPDGVPELDDVAGERVAAEELAHLPSLRNQRGQAHANDDLTSLSWLAAPPFSFGYHTGRLRLDGEVLPAQHFWWKPWGVRREHRSDVVQVQTDTRMLLNRDVVTWQTTITNVSAEPRTYALSQQLLAAVAHSETGWGWLYDLPWNGGDFYDYFTTERVRSSAQEQRGYLSGPGSRRLRLGRARIPGIQRDEDSAPMLLEYELPSHFSTDKVAPSRDAARGTVRRLRVVEADQRVSYAFAGPVHLEPATEVSLEAFELTDGSRLSFDYRPSGLSRDGIILTHGNHPDSLQLGLHAGCLWVAIAGELESSAQPLVEREWHSVEVVMDSAEVTLHIDGAKAAGVKPWPLSERWRSAICGEQVVIADRSSGAAAAYAFDRAPAELDLTPQGATADWAVTLEPGASWTLGTAMAYAASDVPVLESALGVASAFGPATAASEEGWRDLWHAMFTPGNREFSGQLPILVAKDPELSRAYYMSTLILLYLRNTSVSSTEPIFLTGGPRLGPTTTYFWDHTEWSRLYAMLEPVGLRSWLHRVLSGPYQDSFGIDARHGGPLGNEYSSTEYALFRLTEHYISITGDTAFLDEAAGALTIAEHLERLARGWEPRRSEATGGVLADFGDDPWRLLECVPNYVNVVAGFNAAYVAMMRSLAHLHRFRGHPAEADRADADAERLAAAVIGLYAGGGRWSILHPGSTESIGHCLDFGLVAAALVDDLPESIRSEMVEFAATKLVTGAWMRALAADDPVAAYSDRPDHGAGGAFCAWPGVTAHGFAVLGRPDLAVELLRATPAAASGALWGQAMELVGDDEPQRFRVAARGVSNRESIGAGAIAEAVVSGLFGFDRTFADLGRPRKAATEISVEGIGTLRLARPQQIRQESV
jgi:hypothetical protein